MPLPQEKILGQRQSKEGFFGIAEREWHHWRSRDVLRGNGRITNELLEIRDLYSRIICGSDRPDGIMRLDRKFRQVGTPALQHHRPKQRQNIVVKCGGIGGIERNPIMQVRDQAELPDKGIVDLVPSRHDVAYLRGKAGIGGHGPCPRHRLASPILKQDHRIDRTIRSIIEPLIVFGTGKFL